MQILVHLCELRQDGVISFYSRGRPVGSSTTEAIEATRPCTSASARKRPSASKRTSWCSASMIITSWADPCPLLLQEIVSSTRSPRRRSQADRRTHAFGRLVGGCGPWASRAIGHLERGDLVAIAFGQRDVVPAVEQPRAADRIDGEAEGSIAAQDRLLLEIDGYRLARLLARASP